MTAQAYEKLYYKGQEFGMAAEPLNEYLIKKRKGSFISPSTACWRGYYGEWEIKENKLYLIGLEAYIKDYKKVGLDYLFPGKTEVLAQWFTGEIRVPVGEMLQYIHMGYASVFEKDLILQFKNGILISEKEIDNRNNFENKK